MCVPAMHLGLDCSTQSLKAVVVDERLAILCSEQVNYDADLPHFGTEFGVHARGSGRVTQPPRMWTEALDMVLCRLRDRHGVSFDRIVSVSGAGQQHGSVYWRRGAAEQLSEFSSLQPLAEQIEPCLARLESPIWMDSSTASECAALEGSVGGPAELASITGSRAHERFTGNQIAKLYKEEPDMMHSCERISLVSSFMASLFLGRIAPIDWADGSGMNLLDLHTKEWCVVN